mgnify:CR=1 FL=1
MTNAIVQLVKGMRTLDLNSGRYSVSERFVPPPLALAPQMGGGSSANVYGGETLTGQSYHNRDWAFPVHITGASELEVREGAAAIQRFLNWAGDSSEPLYLRYKANSDIPEPLWGQSGSKYYQIEYGRAALSPLYGVFNLRQRVLPECEVAINVKPFAVALKGQRLCSATGGVVEDWIGATDRRSRGPIFPEATTNKMTNPVFGHTTWNNGWTADASLIATQNIDADYVLFEKNSTRLTRIDTAVDAIFYQTLTLTVATHYFSCYARRPDGTAVDASHVRLWYNGAILTTTYTSAGDGWYRLTATATGVAAPAAVGVKIFTVAATVYVDAFQCEALAYATPFCYGGMLGCAWTGTAHASTSTRTAAKVYLDAAADTLSVAAGAVVIAWKAPYANTHANALNLWCDSGNLLRGYFQSIDDKFYMSDGTNTISTAAQTFSAGDVIHLVFAWGPTGLNIYKAGVNVATGATYTAPALGTKLYLAGNSVGASPGYGPFMRFEIFDQELTATQISDDYANAVQLTNDDERVTTLPYFWTKDGDMVVDNCCDTSGSTGAPHDNFGVAGGIPGSAPAETLIDGVLTDAFSSVHQVALSLLDVDYPDFIDPEGYIFSDQSGTAGAVTDAGAAYKQTSVNTTAPQIGVMTIANAKLSPISGKEFFLYMRLYDAGANLTINHLVTYGGSAWESEFKAIAAGTTNFLFTTYPLPTLALKDLFQGESLAATLTVSLYGTRTVAGAANVRVDYIAMMFRPLLLIQIVSNVLVASTNPKGFLYRSTGGGAIYNPTGKVSDGIMATVGDKIELVPERYNILSSLVGDASSQPVITDTITYSKIAVTSRWSLV